MSSFVLLLWAGDYREASERWQRGLPDRYRHHGYALETLLELRRRGHEVTVIQARSERPYDEVRLDGIRMVGITEYSVAETAVEVGRLVREGGATHVAARFPAVPVLEELRTVPARVALVLADSFPVRLRSRARYRALTDLFADPTFEFIANHQLNSSRQLARRLRVAPQRVVPWDWPLDLVELAASSSKATPSTTPVSLGYVGTISRTKGVWELLRAVELLRRRGVDVRLDLAGSGDVDELAQRVQALGLVDHVRMHGRIGGDEVLDLMRDSTFVCVPSRHSYPEGLPLTLYEAMASGTPLVASDHPMFRGVVRPRETGFVFRAGSARSLARTVERAVGDAESYSHVSRTAAAAYPDLGLNTLWGDLLLRWVRDSADDRSWLQERTLAALDRRVRDR